MKTLHYMLKEFQKPFIIIIIIIIMEQGLGQTTKHNI